MKTISIILSSLSTIALVLAIIFEGRLKSKKKSNIAIKTFRKEIRAVSCFGWILLAISVLMNFGNGYMTIANIDDNNKKTQEDSVRYFKLLNSSYEVNKQLKQKRITDSIKILNLENIGKDNGLKSDSIRLSIVDNAVRAMDEQRKAIEKERENIFIHFQNEVGDNLRKTLTNYEEKHIKGFGDTTGFISTRLKNTYIKKYQLISNKSEIIGFLIETAESIDLVNDYANNVLDADNSENKKERAKLKNLNIRMFLQNVKIAQNYLYSIYGRVMFLKSYKEYESINFYNSTPEVDKKSINIILMVEENLKHQGE